MSADPPKARSNTARQRVEDEWLAPWLLVALGASMLWVGWRRWNHVLVDFGRELYVPWRLAHGDVLYRDVAYFNGPLSPYLNATLFRAFGSSYLALALLNIALLGLTLWLIYRLLASLANRSVATVGGVLFLIIFALADLTRAGNYNSVTPYSHEMTHGSLLGLAVLTVFIGYLKWSKTQGLLATGLLMGLLFLTKAEFFLAATVAVAVGLALEHTRLARWGWLLGGLVLPPLVAWLMLLLAMSPAAALKGVIGPWAYVFVEELGDLRFYRHGMGTDAPVGHLLRMVLWSGFYLVLLGPPLFVARRTSPDSGSRRWTALAASLWVAGLTVFLAPRLDMTDLPRPLPIVLTAAVVLMITGQVRGRAPDDPRDWRSIGELACSLYALALLTKMAFHPRFHNYGFALAMPATMVLVAILLQALPASIDRKGGYGPAFRLASTTFLILVALAFAWPSIQVYREKILPFGQGADMFRIQPRYAVVESLLEQLPEYLAPNETLLVLPEGVMLNYQLRRRNPTPFINFMPPELIMFGEENIIAALDASPPDVIVLVKRNTKEYGYESIGAPGYGENLMAWVAERYPIAGQIEDPELWGHDYGKALILRRARQ